MSHEDDAKVIKDLMGTIFEKYIEQNGYPQLTDNTAAVFKGLGQAVIDSATQQGAISPDFRDQFEVKTYTSFDTNSIEAVITPKTRLATQLIFKTWLPDCAILYTDGRHEDVRESSYASSLRPVFIGGKPLSLEFMQHVVEGYIEILRVRDRPDWALVVDEEAKLKKKMVNPTATFLYGNPHDFIAGTVLYCPRRMLV